MASANLRPDIYNWTRLMLDAALYTAADAPEEEDTQPLWDAMALFVEFMDSRGADPFRGQDVNSSDAPQAHVIQKDVHDPLRSSRRAYVARSASFPKEITP